MKPLHILAALFLLLIIGPVAAQDSATEKDAEREVNGTIVSVRGNILQIRPSLRPRMMRVSFSDQTELIGYQRRGVDALKPGQRVRVGGRYSSETGLKPFFIEAAETPIGDLKKPMKGIEKSPNGPFARTGGTLIRVEPLTIRDDDGKETTFSIETLRGIWFAYPEDRNALLIGRKVQAQGVIAPDGVLRAETISPERDQSAAGTMFGEIVRVEKDGALIVRPRYTSEEIHIVRAQDAPLLREIAVDASTIKSGDTVTFWGKVADNELQAYALLLGPGRYPIATTGDDAGEYLTGRITKIKPRPVFTLPDKRALNVVVPGQMIIARLMPITAKELTPGRSVMLVIERLPGGADGFSTKTVIVDASPWVGYGG